MPHDWVHVTADDLQQAASCHCWCQNKLALCILLPLTLHAFFLCLQPVPADASRGDAAAATGADKQSTTGGCQVLFRGLCGCHALSTGRLTCLYPASCQQRVVGHQPAAGCMIQASAYLHSIYILCLP
jgi:hypothetical protein